jgi:uncharacterized membrane protein
MFVAAQEFVRYHHTGLAHPWVGLLFWLFFVGLIGVAVWLFVRTTDRPRLEPVGGPPASPPSDPAMEMLRARFARGEIDTQEFAARAAYLSGQPAPAAADVPTAPVESPEESPDENDGQ